MYNVYLENALESNLNYCDILDSENLKSKDYIIKVINWWKCIIKDE